MVRRHADKGVFATKIFSPAALTKQEAWLNGMMESKHLTINTGFLF
jgi:hypothetical protein